MLVNKLFSFSLSKLSEKGLSACFSLWLSTFLVQRDLRSPTEETASRLEGGR